MKAVKLFTAVVVGALVLSVISMPAAAKDKSKSIEQYQANGMVQAGAGGARTSMVEINIYRWSTDEEKAEIQAAIIEQTNTVKERRMVASALRGQKKAGFVFIAGQRGYPLRYSAEFKIDGGRQIILATDRPVSFQEAYQDSLMKDFDVSIMLLEVDDDGNGKGLLSMGTEVVWNEADGKIEVTNVTSQPIVLENVRRVDK